MFELLNMVNFFDKIFNTNILLSTGGIIVGHSLGVEPHNYLAPLYRLVWNRGFTSTLL